jgi:hypothetical protein
MYHTDLDPIPNEPNAFYVGWLDSSHEYKLGYTHDNFRRRLWVFCNRRGFQSKGFHACDLCEEVVYAREEELEGKRIQLGSAEIRVFGNNDKIYAAPDLIYHYITKHNYCPPEEFIGAVISGPLPGSNAYEELFKRNQYW